MSLFSNGTGDPGCNYYTVMIIPGKYGKTKNLNISKTFICICILTMLLIVAVFGIILVRSTHVAVRDDAGSKRTIKELKVLCDKQKNEISMLKKHSRELNKKIYGISEKEKQFQNILLNGNVSRGKALDTKVSTFSKNTDVIANIRDSVEELNQLIVILNRQKAEDNKIPSILPCTGTITSHFGNRDNPTGGGSDYHPGIDIAGSSNTTIHAAADGVVSFAGWQNGYGNLIIINHGNGYDSYYGHNSKLLVAEGTQVKMGQPVSLMGSTGKSTGVHCHFEIRINGTSVNPLTIIK